MAGKRWITGEEILERWQAAPFELVEAILSGGLAAVNIKTGIKFSEDTISVWEYGRDGKCFFCTKPIEWLTVCHSVRQALHPDKHKNIFCDALRPELTENIRTEERIQKAMELHFLFSEVEAYEKAHGLASSAEQGATAPQAIENCAEPLPTDSPEDYAQRLKSLHLHRDEIKYRLYRLGLPRWKMTQWKAHCIAEDVPYPPNGLKGETDRNNHKAAYLRSEKRFLESTKNTE